MNSKIRVEYDFDKKEPFIQFHLDSSPELLDRMLVNFLQNANNKPIVLVDNELRIIYDDLNHNIHAMGCFCGVMENFTKPFFYNVDEATGKELGKIYSDFFNRLYDCIDPKLKGIKPVESDLPKRMTIRGVFETRLSDEERFAAFNNTPKYKWDSDVESDHQALNVAFDHATSPEGYDYWNKVLERLK